MSNPATEKVTLQIAGMQCASCVQAVEKSLKGTPGVDETKVNLATEKAIVEFNPAAVGEASLIEAVKKAGYAVKDKTSEPGGQDDLEKVGQAKSRMKIAWAFTVPLMVWMLVKIITGSAWALKTAS